VSARYDVQTLTIPALSQARQAVGCVTTGVNLPVLLNIRPVIELVTRKAKNAHMVKKIIK
jgi:hypothetical protein